MRFDEITPPADVAGLSALYPPLGECEPPEAPVDGPTWSFLEGILPAPTTRAWCVTNDSGQALAAVWYTVVAGEAEVIDVRVAAGHRRQGLGRNLLLQSLHVLATSQVTLCHLEVRRSNSPARSLYAQLGFVEVGLRPNYYRIQSDPEHIQTGFEDAILMTLNLTPDELSP